MIVDEVQHILHAGAHGKLALLDTLKSITNQGFAIVASGTREALAVFRSHEQLSRRFETLELSRLKMDTEFRQLLMTIEREVPLRERSGLSEREIAQELHAMSSGLLGKLWRDLERATLLAIDGESERITLDILKRVARSSGGAR